MSARASGSLRISRVSSSWARSSGLRMTAAGRPLRVTVTRSCSCSTRSTTSLKWSRTSRRDSVLMATIVARDLRKHKHKHKRRRRERPGQRLSGLVRTSHRRVALASKPTAGPAALPVVGERVPARHQLGPLGQPVLETPEGAAAGDRAGKLVREALVVEVVDEPLHVPVPVARPLAGNPQPAFGIIIILVDLADLLGVLDRGLRPHLSGAQVDATAAVDWVSLKDHGELLQIHLQWPQHRSRPAA